MKSKASSPTKGASAPGREKSESSGNGNERKSGLEKLFEDQIADIYYAEQQLTKALPKMARAAGTADLRHAFESHLQETEAHVERLREVFDLLGKSPRAKKCDAIEGIIREANEMAGQFEGTEALDAALIAAAQKAEHYEISTYGTLVAWADELGHSEASSLLLETLGEEKAADEKLSEIASESANATAMSAD